MDRGLRAVVSCLVLVVFVLNISGCGTILYPERAGQRGGRIDPAIVILDGIGLFFGVVPGLIAFAVDFANGTIYFPPGHSRLIDIHDLDSALKIKVDPAELTKEKIEEIVAEHFDLPAGFSLEQLEVSDITHLVRPDLELANAD